MSNITAYNPSKNISINVIGIEWGELANVINYISAAFYSVEVGKYVGEHVAVKMLIEGLGQNPDKIEAVGHSLGAHLVGHLGRIVFNKTGSKIARATGTKILRCRAGHI